MKKFWNWVTNDAGERTLRLEGPIDSDDVWGDSVTPAWFRNELESGEGDITVWINSPGGSVFAAAEIYTMLKDYKGKVTVKIDAIAASAASVVAMAGDQILMSPVAMLMLHDPATVAMGNTRDMQKAIDTLEAVKASIVNAYSAKTGLSRNRISTLMTNETWLDAREALKLGFCDEILFVTEEDGADESDSTAEGAEEAEPEEGEEQKGIHLYSTKLMNQMILNRLGVEDCAGASHVSGPAPEGVNPEANAAEPDNPGHGISDQPVIGLDGKTADGGVPFLILEKQLEFLK